MLFFSSMPHAFIFSHFVDWFNIFISYIQDNFNTVFPLRTSEFRFRFNFGHFFSIQPVSSIAHSSELEATSQFLSFQILHRSRTFEFYLKDRHYD